MRQARTVRMSDFGSKLVSACSGLPTVDNYMAALSTSAEYSCVKLMFVNKEQARMKALQAYAGFTDQQLRALAFRDWYRSREYMEFCKRHRQSTHQAARQEPA